IVLVACGGGGGDSPSSSTGSPSADSKPPPPPPTRYDVVATAEPVEGGTITGSGNYVSGSTVQLIATAREHYRFVGWEEQGELSSEETEVELEINEPRTLVARFAPVEQVQEVTLPPAGH